MARYVANSTGNLNTAATWDTVANTPTIHASTDISVTTGGVKTVGFTAPNTTNAATGVVVYASTYPASGRNWTATLEESGVATAAIATIVQTDMPVTAGFIYFRLPTPYVYTTTGASAYKWIIKSTVANSGSVAADSGGANPAFWSTDDRNVAPSADQVQILAHNCVTGITVTIDGTAGNITGGSNPGFYQTSPRNTTSTIYVGGALTDSLALLKFDTAASSTLRFTSDSYVSDGGEIQAGTVASPYPSGKNALLRVNGNSTALYCIGTGKLTFSGNPLTYTSTTYVSGTGVAASPLVVSDPVDWTVGDRIVISATSANATNYNETENRFIITKNSSTSYVLSTTSGGAEAAFTYTHSTSAIVLNITRNVTVESVTTSFGHSLNVTSTNTNTFKWMRDNYGGAANSNYSLTGNFSQAGIFVTSTANSTSVDNSVFFTSNGYGIIIKNTTAKTFTNNIFYLGNTNSANSKNAGIGITSSGQTISNSFFIGNNRMGIDYRGVNGIFTSNHFSANNISNTSGEGAFYCTSGAPFTMTSPDMHANRLYGFVLNGTTNSVVTSGQIGTKGANQTIDVFITSNSANKILFDTCSFGSTTLVSGHLNGAVGATLIAFDTLNGTTNNHKWYTEYGSAQSTGTGLSDTTVRTASTLNVRVAAEEATTGFKYEYKILAVPAKAVFALGFIQRNAAFATDTCLVELFLPGSTTADASQTMATTVGTYLPFSIAATYNGSVSRYATVRISAKTTTSAAYIYIADLFNGTNNITNFNTWFEGQPSSIMFEQLGDAAAVWAVPISTMTTSGTIGYYIVKKLLSVAKFLSLK